MTTFLSSSAPETLLDGAGATPHTPALPVAFRSLRRTFGTGADAHTVLRDIDFDIHAGEVLAILGTSGCGKSTLLRAAAGLDSPTTGRVDIDGTPVQGIDARCAFAFQEPRLLPWHTLQANIAIGLPPGISARDGKAKVSRLLELVGLTEFAKHRPREISGGMAQRASLARALARNPGVLLLDEPFGALDALTRINMQDLLLDIHRAEPTTVLLVTHDVDEALQLADRIIILGTGNNGVAGSPSAAPGATIVRTVAVPGGRPRDRGSVELARLRASLLATLGVDGH
ncbi:ABC transporter ATP-binding protein [Pseudarthrobacter sp. So.54]